MSPPWKLTGDCRIQSHFKIKSEAIFFFFYKDTSIHEQEIYIEEERHGEKDLPSICWLTHQMAAVTKTELIKSGRLLCVSHVGAGNHQKAGSPSTSFLGLKQGAKSKAKQLGHKKVPM